MQRRKCNRQENSSLVIFAGAIDRDYLLPCYKLGLKFGRDDILKRFLRSGLTGFYFKVLKEGEVAAGDPIRLLHRDEHEVKVADITRLYRQDKHNLDLLRRVVTLEALPASWRDYFLEGRTQFAGSTSSDEAAGSADVGVH